DLHPPRSGADPHPPRGLVDDLDVVQCAQVDHDAAVVGGASADAVATAAHAEGEVRMVAGEADGIHHFFDGARSQHNAGGASAQVVGAHVAVLEVARLDRVV